MDAGDSTGGDIVEEWNTNMKTKFNIGKIVLCFLVVTSMIVGSYLILLTSDIESDENIATTLKDPHDPHPGGGGGQKDPVDLQITNIFTIPSTPVGGESVTIYAKIENMGEVDVNKPFYNTLYIDGSYAASKYLEGLIGGGSSYISKTVTLDSGYHELKAITDTYDDVHEANEGNNQRIENILWEGGSPTYPDLIVTSVVVYNDVTNGIINSVYSGWPIRISATVKNNGAATAGASVVELRDILGGSPTVMGTASVPALAVGATYTAIFDDKYISSIGTHTIRAVADSTGVVTESSETNNAYDKINFVVSLSKWTVAVYMDADSYLDPYEETLMEPWAIGDITEMQLAGGTAYGTLNIIILIDMFDGEGGFPSTAGVYIVRETSVYQIANLGEVNMGDPSLLNSFLCTQSIGRFKASQSMLVLWGHGGGCIGGLFEDEHISSGDNEMSIPDLGIALHPYYGAHIDILAFHACLMSCLEVGFEAYYEASNGDIVVGFEEAAYVDGFPYDDIFNYILANPTASDVTVAYQMVERTYLSYQDGGSQDDDDDYDEYLSIAAYYNHYGYPDHGFLCDIAYEVGDVGYILYNDEEWWPAYYARIACEDFAQNVFGGGYIPVDWAGFYVDTYDFMRRLRDYSDNVNNWDLYYACQDVLDALDDARIHYRTGYYHDTAYGLSLYFPWNESDRDAWASEYDALAMTQFYWAWNQFTDEYPYSPY